jgi:hypothetical protein
MVEITYQMVLSTLQTVGLLVGIFYYLMVLRNQQKNQEISLKNQELTLQSQELSRKALEQAAETRQGQLLMQLYAHLREDKFNTQFTELRRYEWRDYDDFMEKYGDDIEFRAMINYVCSFFEGVGVLVYRNLLDPQLVDDLMSSYIFLTWEKIGPYIKEIRLRRNRPELWDKFEYLYEEIMKIYIQEHGHRFSPSS